MQKVEKGLWLERGGLRARSWEAEPQLSSDLSVEEKGAPILKVGLCYSRLAEATRGYFSPYSPIPRSLKNKGGLRLEGKGVEM